MRISDASSDVCSSDPRFEAATDLSLQGSDGGLKDELPGINTFLNRMLALTVAMQNLLFEAFEGLLVARIEQARASDSYEIGLETLQAESFRIVGRTPIYTHPGTGAQRSEEHTSELQSLMRISSAVFCLKKKT